MKNKPLRTFWRIGYMKWHWPVGWHLACIKGTWKYLGYNFFWLEKPIENGIKLTHVIIDEFKE